MTLRIDGLDIRAMSADQIGATLERIASELSVRGNDMTLPEGQRARYLWVFERAEEAGRALRNYFR